MSFRALGSFAFLAFLACSKPSLPPDRAHRTPGRSSLAIVEHDAWTGEHMFRDQWTQIGGNRSHESRGNCGVVPSLTSRIVGGYAEVLERIGAACEIEGGCSRTSDTGSTPPR